MTVHPEPDPESDALAGALRALADGGLGTILGVTDAVLRRGRARRVARAPGGFADLLERLYRDNHAGLVGYAMRRLSDRPRAEDVVARAYEKVWKRSPDPDELDNPTAYLVTATRNEINRELRRVVTERDRTATPTAPDGDGAAAEERLPAPGDVAGQVIDRMALREALAALPAREREAVVLRMQWQLSVDEAAEVMGVGAGSVKGYTHHGLRKLRERLDAA